MTFEKLASDIDSAIRLRVSPEHGGKVVGHTVSWRIDPLGRNLHADVTMYSKRVKVALFRGHQLIGDRLQFALHDDVGRQIGTIIADHFCSTE